MVSNAELLMIYLKFKKYNDNLDKNLSKNLISKEVDTPLGKGIAYIDVPADHVEQFKQTEYYKLSHTIVEKLSPLVELLLDCDESLKKLADELR